MLDDQFKNKIFNVLSNDEIGCLAKSDPIILMVGYRLYGKIKHRLDKKSEVERSARSDMRRLKNRKCELLAVSKRDNNNSHSGTGLKLFPANTAALPPVFFKNHFKEKISPPAAAAGFCGFIAGTRLITAKPGGGSGR